MKVEQKKMTFYIVIMLVKSVWNIKIDIIITIRTQSKRLYVMLTYGKTQKYNFLNRMKYIAGSLVKSSGKISREH